VFKTLRSYLQQELLARKGVAAPLTSKELVGKYSKVYTLTNQLSSLLLIVSIVI